MKVIKEGSSERMDIVIDQKLNRPKKFFCYQCGCEFEANKTEYFRKFLVSYRCHCPQCGYQAKEVVEYYDM